MRPLLLALSLLAAGCPAPEEPACPDGQVQDEDSGACVPEACGTGRWGLIERDSDTVHVAPWGEGSGDGSEDSPYRTIQEGADEADSLVVVAAGTYLENLVLDVDHDGVVLAGRCPELSVIDGSGEEAWALNVAGGDVALRGVTLTGGTGGVLVERVGFGAVPEVGLQGVVLAGNSRVGLGLAGAGVVATCESVVIRDTQPLADGTLGRGIEVHEGASLVARGLLLEGNHDIGLFALSGATVDLDDATIRDTQPRPDGTGGRGISVQEAGSVVARGLLLEGNHDVGLFASSGATVDLEDTTIRDTQPLPDGTFGRGIGIQGGARLLARGLLLEWNHAVGLFACQAGTTADLEDATIRDTQPLPDGTGGRGISVQEGASLVASGLLLERNHNTGLFASLAWTTLDLEDATIRDTQPLPDGTGGWGISLQEGAGLVAGGLLLDRNHEIGLLAALAGTTVDLEDATIRDTQPLPNGTGGWGIAIQNGGSLLTRGLLLERNHAVGLGAADAGTTVDLEDATIRDTQPLPDGTFGRGIGIQDGGCLLARGLLLERNHEVGLLATGAGTTVDVDDATILDTRGAGDSASGMGVIVQQEASLLATGFLVEDSDGPGLYVVSGGALSAWDTSLLRNGFAGAVVKGAHLALHGGGVSGSTAHPSEGGGVGLFACDGPSDLDLDGVSFSDLPGPALYLRGPGRYVMRDCDVSDAGTPPWLPGGVLALEGVQPWHEVGDTGFFTGLLLAGNSLGDLASDAILLDASSATLDVDPETGTPNTFGALDGVPLLWQRCTAAATPEILDGSIPAPACEPVPRNLGPPLEYRLRLAEVEPIE